MCLDANKSLSKANKTVALYELHLFILDEIGQHSFNQFVLHAPMHYGAGNTRKPIVVDHDIGEDG